MEVTAKENGINWDRIEDNLSMLKDRQDDIIEAKNVQYDEGRIGTHYSWGHTPTDHAMKQLFRKLDMPSTYFSELHNEGDYHLVEQHVEHNKFRLEDKKLMLRRAKFEHNGYEESVVRAVLSDSYSPLDNDTLVEIVRQTLSSVNYKITHYKNDWNTLMLRILFEDKLDKVEVEEGDILQTGITVVNSEVGKAGILIAPTVLRLVCNNGMTAWDTIENDDYYRRHVGLSETKIAAFARDAVVAARKEGLERAKMLKETAGKKLPEDVTGNEMIENILDNKNIRKSIIEQAQEVLEERYEDRNDVYSVVNSITRTARDLENTEDRMEVERTVGDYVHEMVA